MRISDINTENNVCYYTVLLDFAMPMLPIFDFDYDISPPLLPLSFDERLPPCALSLRFLPLLRHADAVTAAADATMLPFSMRATYASALFFMRCCRRDTPRDAHYATYAGYVADTPRR